jgi:Bardet-Biedl syndrome 1 protein
MHQIFQNDLIKLRYKTLDTYVKLLKVGNAPQNYNTTSKLKLSASLQGLGPNFRLQITVDNTGNEAITGVDLILGYDKLLYMFEKEFIQVD